MRLLKAIAALIFLFGLLLMALGSYGLFTVDWHVQLFEKIRRAGVGGPLPFGGSELRAALIQLSIANLILGLFYVVCGLGTWFRKNWARLLFLVVLILMTGLETLTLWSKYRNGFLDADEIAGFCILVVIVLGFFGYFNRLKIKKLFIEA